MTKIFSASLLLLLSAVPMARADAPTPCLVALGSMQPKLPGDMKCVSEKSPEAFKALCLDGANPSQEFRAYLQFRSKYLAAKEERDAWLSANPGKKVSPALDAKVKNAENAWISVGRRSQVEENFEKLHRGAVDCEKRST